MLTLFLQTWHLDTAPSCQVSRQVTWTPENLNTWISEHLIGTPEHPKQLSWRTYLDTTRKRKFQYILIFATLCQDEVIINIIIIFILRFHRLEPF